ncbi:MAG TPA: hypothetical protein VGF76_11160 [Polyangiaceae bacterium]|jgi:hypothetical protein
MRADNYEIGLEVGSKLGDLSARGIAAQMRNHVPEGPFASAALKVLKRRQLVGYEALQSPKEPRPYFSGGCL